MGNKVVRIPEKVKRWGNVFLGVCKALIVNVKNLFRREGVLVEQGAQRGIKAGKLEPQRDGPFEKGLDADGPELLVVGTGIRVQNGGFTSLHPFVYWSGDQREIPEPVVKGLVAAFLDREVHVSERMCHFM